jgi:hypothetical protein
MFIALESLNVRETGHETRYEVGRGARWTKRQKH